MSTDKITNYAEALASVKTARNTSNLSNLAHARIMVEQRIEELTALAKEIDLAGSDVDNTTDIQVRTLYSRAQGTR